MIVHQALNSHLRKKVKESMLKELSDFTETKQYVGDSHKTYLGVDSKNSKVLIAYIEPNNITKEIIDNFSVSKMDSDSCDLSFVLVDEVRQKVLALSFSLKHHVFNYKIVDNYIGSSIYVQKSPVFNNKRIFYIVDDAHDKIIIGTLFDSSYKQINYSDISRVELIEDGQILQQKSSVRTISGSIIGGLIGGKTWAVIGGLSGDVTQKKIVKNVAIKLLLRNLEESSYTISCLLDYSEMTTSSSSYKELRESINKVCDVISVIIDKVDQKESTAQIEKHTRTILPNNEVNTSVADELTKLAQLKEQGILNEAEFNQLKVKLLSQI